MTDHDDICLQKTWPLIVQLMAALTALVSSAAVLSRVQHLGAMRRMRLAESLVRRWLVLRACQTLRSRKAPSAPPAPRRKPAAPFARSSTSAPFRLDDPFPSMDIGLSFSPRSSEPGEHVWSRPWGVARQASSRARSCPLVVTAQAADRLRHRAQALQDVIDHTERHIARMRRRIRRGFRPYQRPPLRPGTGPGADARQRRQGHALQSALHNLNFFAREALCACGPPSPVHTLY